METWTTLKQSAKDLALNDQSSTFDGLSDDDTFLGKGINDTVRHIFNKAREYKMEPPPQTVTTVDGTTYYENPAGINAFSTVTMTVGNIVYPLEIIDSQETWNKLREVPVTGGIPSKVFPRRDDFGIWPTPGGAYTVTIVGNYYPINMSQEDYTTGTITTVVDDATITGGSTTFIAGMVGRVFRVEYDAGGYSNWYRIETFTSTTSMELSRTFTDTAATTDSYRIGEAPNLPESLHEYIPYRAAAIYYQVRRKDAQQAKALMNYFYTGDFEDDRRKGKVSGGVLGELQMLKERGRGNSQITYTADQEGSYNYIRDGIWGLTLS